MSIINNTRIFAYKIVSKMESRRKSRGAPKRQTKKQKAREDRKTRNEAQKIASKAAKDRGEKEKWQTKRKKQLDESVGNLPDADIHSLLAHQHQRHKKYLRYYKALCDENKKKEVIQKDTANSPAQEEVTTENLDFLFDNKELKTAIEAVFKKDPNKKTKDLVMSRLACLNRSNQEFMTDDLLAPGKIDRNLSQWNELIERGEGRDIAKWSPLALIGADLSPLAAIRHEADNSQVTIMRRTLEDYAENYKDLQSQLNQHREEGKDISEALQSVVESLRQFYNKKENQKEYMQIVAQTNDAAKRRKRLKLVSKIIAVSGLLLIPLAVYGIFSAVVALFPPSIALAPVAKPTIAAVVSLFVIPKAIEGIKIATQMLTGFKLLPHTDYAAELIEDFSHTHTHKLKHFFSDTNSREKKHRCNNHSTLSEQERSFVAPKRPPRRGCCGHHKSKHRHHERV